MSFALFLIGFIIWCGVGVFFAVGTYDDLKAIKRMLKR